MSNIFDTSLLSSEPARYTVIAEAVLPGFLILILGYFMTHDRKEMGKYLNGVPEGLTYALIWFLIVVLWTLALVVAALNFSATALAVVAGTSFLALIMGTLWVYMYSKRSDDEKNVWVKSTSAPQVLLVAVVALLTSAVAAAGNAASEESRIAVSSMLAAISGFYGYFLLLNYLDINTHQKSNLRVSIPE